jgi:hypothetical protein
MPGRHWGLKTPNREVEDGMNDLTGWQLTAVLSAIVVILAALYLIGCGDGCALP